MHSDLFQPYDFFVRFNFQLSDFFGQLVLTFLKQFLFQVIPFLLTYNKHSLTKNQEIILRHSLGIMDIGTSDQTRIWVDERQKVLTPGLLDGKRDACHSSEHDNGLQLSSRHVSKIGPIVSRLGKICPENIKVWLTIVIDHLLVVIATIAGVGF